MKKLLLVFAMLLSLIQNINADEILTPAHLKESIDQALIAENKVEAAEWFRRLVILFFIDNEQLSFDSKQIGRWREITQSYAQVLPENPLTKHDTQKTAQWLLEQTQNNLDNADWIPLLGTSKYLINRTSEEIQKHRITMLNAILSE